MHTTPSSIQELNKAYELFTIVELEIAINKMKRKSPGHDTLTIDCFKHLGPGGKHRLLDVYNEIYSTGNFPLRPSLLLPHFPTPSGWKNPGIPHPH